MNRLGGLALTSGAFGGIRMVVGVYHAAYLLSTGLNIQEIATLQLIFSITIFLLDIPTSVMAVKWGCKKPVLAGVLLTTSFYPLCFFSPNMSAMIFAEILYGAGICCVSGAVDHWALKNADYCQDLFKKNIHNAQRWESLGGIIAGLGGVTLLYTSTSYSLGYIFSSIAMLVVFLSFSLIAEPANKKHISKSPVRSTAISLWKLARLRNARFYIMLIAAYTGGIQIVYHFWQPMFLTSYDAQKLEKLDYFILAGCHCGAFLAQYIAHTAAACWNLQYFRCVLYGTIGSTVSVIILIILLFQDYKPLAVIAYVTLHGFICLVPTGGKIIFIKSLKSEDQDFAAPMISTSAIAGRGASILVLAGIAFNDQPITPVFYLYISLALFTICALTTWSWLIATKP